MVHCQCYWNLAEHRVGRLPQSPAVPLDKTERVGMDSVCGASSFEELRSH